MKSILLFVLFVVICFPRTSAQETLPALNEGLVPQNFEQLWKGFDPQNEPLDVEILKEWEQDGVVLKVVRYRIGIFKGKKSMMAAIYGYPKGAKNIPGLVQIHGGGQYAHYKAVLSNAKRGYATISIAWAGRLDAPEYKVNPDVVKLYWENKTDDPQYKITTDWGALDGYHAPSKQSGPNAFVSITKSVWTIDSVFSPRNNSWFLCTMGARRALTFLEEQPEVDGRKLGVYGHSMGGKLTVLTAGSDSRVKAAAPSCGGISDRYNNNPLHRNTVGDSPYLKHISCPTMFLSPANDFHGRVSDLPQAVSELKTKQWRTTCNAHINHRDLPSGEVSTQLWFDQHLKGTFNYPETPQSELQLKTADGIPAFLVKPDVSKKIISVDVYYTQQGIEGGDPKARENHINQYWHHASARVTGDTWATKLPVLDINKPLWVYANVLYELDQPVSGVGYYYGDYTAKNFNLSSMVKIVKPGELQAARVQATLKPSFVIETFEGDWKKNFFRYQKNHWEYRTHKIYNPLWKAPAGGAIAIDVQAQQENKFVIGIDSYAAEVTHPGGGGWKTVTLNLSDFKDAKNQPLESWQEIKELRLIPAEHLRSGRGKETTLRRVGGTWKGRTPQFKNLRWVTPHEKLETTEMVTEKAKAFPFSNKDYSFGYWQNGYRKHKSDTSKDILCLETGYFGLVLDMAELAQVKFGRFHDDLDYTGALEAGESRMSQLENAELNIELEKDGKVYRARNGVASKERLRGERFQGTRLWESARYVQNFEIQGLEFEAADGERLMTDSALSIVVWPNSLSLTSKVAPAITYKTGPELGVHGNGICVKEKPHVMAHRPELEHEQFTLESWIKIPNKFFNKGHGWLLCKNQNESTEGNYGFSIRGRQIRATLNIGGGAQNRFDVQTGHHQVVADTWHHLAMSYDGKTFSLFVDGHLKDSKVIGKKRILGKGSLSLGKRGDDHGGVAPVIMDQIRVWNRPLSKKELLQHARTPTVIKNRDGLSYEENFETGAAVKHPVWENTKMSVRLKDAKNNWYAEKQVTEKWGVGVHKKVTMNCSLVSSKKDDAKLAVTMKLNKLSPVTYDKEFNAFVARIDRPKRDWRGGYSANRNYDDIDITIDSQEEKTIPFLLEMFNPANITGLCPILCDENGVPTGIPVQLSKNWHYQKMGPYLRAYALLPTIKGQKKYKLRIIYGFYGKVPSASHAQLSLVGYSGNGRWDQLAIGSWGETYCMDMDMSCVDVAVTDVRMLMARNGLKGKLWGWTDAGWGGDWLSLSDTKGQKHLFNGIKTAYLTHGPCLTEVKYDGYYGTRREVDFETTVRTLRTDDYARTFTTIKYTFDKSVKADGWLFKMGRTSGYTTPQITYGNGAGLIKEHQVPKGLKNGTTFIPKTTLTGEGPWWVSFPGAYTDRRKGWGSGYRAMVIRSYKADIGGKKYTHPTVEFTAYRSAGEGEPNLDFLMAAPEGVTMFNPGDRIEFDVEWITLPRVAADYYGPNAIFRKHVAETPSSWKTAYREAIGNNLKVYVDGGKLLNNYPIIIQTDQDEVTVEIDGGVGFVPIRFEGMKQAKGYALYQVIDGKEVRLDQSVHGNDYWQTDYDVKSNCFKMSFNLPLDGHAKSKWILR